MIEKLNKSEKGFTLVEITIVIIIAGVLLSLLSSALLTYIQKNRITTTEFRIEKIQEAIEKYVNVNRKYPCPASRVVGPDNANFGTEVTVDCNTAAGAGAGAAAPTVRVGAGANRIRIGAVPTRVLNLPDEFMIDAWGNKFTYAVTENLASSPRVVAGTLTRFFENNGGRIIVRDRNNNELVQAASDPASRAHYVIVSHGASGAGAYPLGAATAPPTPCPGAGIERENCDHSNRVFRASLINSDAAGGNFFDDYVAYQGQTLAVPIVPENAVIAFAGGACPTGGDWEPYVPAQGRFIMGFDGTPPLIQRTRMQIVGVVPAVQDEGDEDTVDAVSENANLLLPPYVALIYCRKIR